MSVVSILQAANDAIKERLPKLRKGSIDDQADAIVRPSVSLHVVEGKPEWDTSGTKANVPCKLLVIIQVANMKLFEERIREALIVEESIVPVLHGIEPDGCQQFEYSGWKDITNATFREERISVLQASYDTAYTIDIGKQDLHALESILTSYEQTQGSSDLSSQTDFQQES